MKKAVPMVIVMAIIACSGCIKTNNAKMLTKPRVFLDLPEKVNGPDGMTLAPNGNIMIASPNFVNPKYPGVIIEVDKENNWKIFTKALRHPETKKGHPMGMDYGPDGNLYYADNQYFNDKNYKSSLMRVIIKDGKAKKVEVVVEGFKLSNAVIWRGNDVFVSDTFFDVKDKPGMSGIFRFSLDELNKGVVKLKPSLEDEHLIAKFTTIPNERGDVAGADGMTIDSRGNLYCGNFGDGVMSKITFDKNNNVASQKIISRAISCCDGIFCDLRTDNIYITDSAKNAIHVMRPTGAMKTVWQNGDSDGSDGLLDQPCEPLIRGDELIVVNFDFATPEWNLLNKQPDDKHNISVFDLK